MKDHHFKAKDLVTILDVRNGLVSDMLKYEKGLSQEIIRIQEGYSKVSPEAYNRPFQLITPANSYVRTASVMNMWEKVE